MKPPLTGLALGSGAARGWAHIGVIQALDKLGVHPEVVCGASNGALVGGIHAAGNLDNLTEWLMRLRRLDVLRLLDPGLRGGGFIRGERLMEALSPFVGESDIDALGTPFGAVATDLRSGREVWLREGPLRAALRASIALPGLFTPIRWQDRWLTDGGLVNPVPVSLCRAMGADIVIAVNVNADLLQRPARAADSPGNDENPLPAGQPAAADSAEESNWIERIKEGLHIVDLRQQFEGFISNDKARPEDSAPGLVEVIASSIDIMQDRITRSRMVGEPPDILITPQVADIHLMDFHRAGEAIAAGERAVEAAREEIDRFCETGAR